MRKRILSIVLCLSMALTLLPMAAFATETGVPAEPVVQAETMQTRPPLVASANTVELDIKDGAIRISPTGYRRGNVATETAYTGSYVITGTSALDGSVHTAITVISLAENATLTLKDLTIGSTTCATALSLAGEPSVPEVCIEGAVSLGGLTEAIKANGALNLTGSGSLALDVVSSAPSSSPAVAVVSAASVAANLTGDITVSATATNTQKPATTHAIKTDGAVSLISQNGAVSLISSGTTAPLISAAGAVTISGYGDVTVRNNAGGMAISTGNDVSLTSDIGKVDVCCQGSAPAISS
ncbi:MAG: hypothetical protein RRY64_08620, partial [Oscillospiraceae bacterium]